MDPHFSVPLSYQTHRFRVTDTVINAVMKSKVAKGANVKLNIKKGKLIAFNGA